MKKKFLFGMIIGFAIATVVSSQDTLLYGTLLFIATLAFGREVEKDEE